MRDDAETLGTFASVWDALADTPQQAANLRGMSRSRRSGSQLDPETISTGEPAENTHHRRQALRDSGNVRIVTGV